MRAEGPGRRSHVAGGFVLVDENVAGAKGEPVFDTPKTHRERLLRVGIFPRPQEPAQDRVHRSEERRLSVAGRWVRVPGAGWPSGWRGV
jgi:hypothetical protein